MGSFRVFTRIFLIVGVVLLAATLAAGMLWAAAQASTGTTVPPEPARRAAKTLPVPDLDPAEVEQILAGQASAPVPQDASLQGEPRQPTQEMYWKPGGWLDYAPNGLPDFDQKQLDWGSPGKWTFCGPVAAANSLWWFDSKNEIVPAVPPPTIFDSYHLIQPFAPFDDHDPLNVQLLVPFLSAFFNTSRITGTEIHNMYAGMLLYLNLMGLGGEYSVTLQAKPTYEWVDEEVRRSEDVILLLGFWQQDPATGEWFRLGGHYVTVAGVGGDQYMNWVAFSDPYRDLAEVNGLGRVMTGTLLPHLPVPHPDPTLHNDAGNLSHDMYPVQPTTSPGGVWGPVEFPLYPEEVANFFGQNVPVEFISYQASQPFIDEQIFVEVEYALAVSPASTGVEWVKLVQGVPWDSSITYTVETSDLIQVMDVVTTDRPFDLVENWDTKELSLVHYVVSGGNVETPGEGALDWNVDPPEPGVYTLIKVFHVEPCTWRTTTLTESLAYPPITVEQRVVRIQKIPPELHIAHHKNLPGRETFPDVSPGEQVSFTLFYSNTGGYENDVVVRNQFPITAPIVGAYPAPTRQGTDGTWAEWEVGDLKKGNRGEITVTVEISTRAVISTIIEIYDWIVNHVGERVERTDILYHVAEPTPPPYTWTKLINGVPWDPSLIVTTETSDTITIVDVVETLNPFILEEAWTPAHLELLEVISETHGAGNIDQMPGYLIYVKPPGPPEVITITKIFHVKPCTWTATLLNETLIFPGGEEISRPVNIAKTQPVLTIGSAYDPEVQAGQEATFTLTVMNSGGREVNVVVRNDFPPEALFLASDPAPTDQDPQGTWATWEYPVFNQGEKSILVTVTIEARMVPSQTIEVVDVVMNHLGETMDTVTTTYHIACPGEPDLGDAPDSSNHFGLPMFTYSGQVFGLYPTVYDPGTGFPPGPVHWLPSQVAYLGAGVSTENDADLLPDQDGVTNIVPPANLADQDQFDDGLVPGSMDLNHCQASTFEVQYTIVGTATPLYLNAWFDWNRDGDWDDPIIPDACPNRGVLSEWVVKNLVVFNPPGTYTLTVPAFNGYQPDREIWMRLTLAELMAVGDTNLRGAPHNDGRGPLGGYMYGETEDYLITPPPLAWEKWVNGIPWNGGLSIQVQTSDTITVVDVISGVMDAMLMEQWNRAALHLLSAQSTIGEVTVHAEHLTWEISEPGNFTGVLTKVFHIEPCTWTTTILVEQLLVHQQPIEQRRVFIHKIAPRLEIDSQYAPEVQAGELVTFTLLYSNTGGREFEVAIKNAFPPEAPFVQSEPAPDAYDQEHGRWALWKIGKLETNEAGKIDVTVAISPTLQPSTTIVIQDDIVNHVGDVADSTFIEFHVAPPPLPRWEKWIDGISWVPRISFTMQTSDTFTVVDVVKTNEGFSLEEVWNPARLSLVSYSVEPESMVFADPGYLEWIVLPGSDKVYTLTKVFHVEPCNWKNTVLEEFLYYQDEVVAEKPVTIVKDQPILGINSQYDPEVQAGKPATFTLTYSNTGGREVNVMVRNTFPPSAPFASSDPPPYKYDEENGSWAEWLLGTLEKNASGNIRVTVNIAPGLVPSTTVHIEDVILDHLGEVAGVTAIDFHVKESPAPEWRKWVDGIPWTPNLVLTRETSDTITIQEVITTYEGFTLVEVWTPANLKYLGGKVSAGDLVSVELGEVIWIVPDVGMRVVTATKTFHVEPCTWEVTTLYEYLFYEQKSIQRDVSIIKLQPRLWIDSLGGGEVELGGEVEFTLRYGNMADAGFEPKVRVRNEFPREAPFVKSEPSPSRFDTENGLWAEWDVGDLDGGDSGQITVTVELQKYLPFSSTVEIVDWIIDHAGRRVDVVTTTYHVTRPLLGDLGDAPDSTNHAGAMMTAYPAFAGVAWYPTVFDPATGLPPGPIHWYPSQAVFLGQNVSLEFDADLFPDQDLTPNIIPAADLANLDAHDDGLVRKSVNLKHCAASTFDVIVTLPAAGQYYLNAWFDWNRDGDWRDSLDCQVALADEWVVRNYALPNVPGVYTITVPAFLAYHPEQPTWLRLTVAEQPAPHPTGPDNRSLPNPDGQGPAQGYLFGETEDYFLLGSVPPAWEKFVDGKPWEPQIVVRRQTSDTLTIVDVIYSADPFSLAETWNPAELHLIDAFATYGKVTQAPGLGQLTWEVTPFENKVFTLTKVFHVEPCTWTMTIVQEQLFDVSDQSVESKAVKIEKIQPDQWIESFFDISVIPGRPATFTLRYGNKPGAGLESRAWIRNEFPETARFVSSTPPPTEADPNGLWAWWDLGDLKAGEEGQIDVTVLIDARVQPSATIAIWDWIYNHVNEAVDDTMIHYHVIAPPELNDLGDAPDSVANHHNMANTAYLGVNGRFPTVWAPPAGLPNAVSGPLHFDIRKVWLGNQVTGEHEADIGFDMDGVNNILDLGNDVSDLDQMDDGWLNRGVPFIHCQATTLKVRVSKAIGANVGRLYLNVWMDGNRDGDWEDLAQCPGILMPAREWLVKNYVIDASAITGFVDLAVPTGLVMNTTPGLSHWMRFTLSEKPAVLVPGSALADGRGPQYPAYFDLGETEDYIQEGDPIGEPGVIEITKAARPVNVTVGDLITYEVTLAHAGGSGVAHTVMTDVLPAEVALAGTPWVNVISPAAGPLHPLFLPGVGPNGAVAWAGDMTPGAVVQVGFLVKVIHCPPDVQAVINTAYAWQTDGTQVSATTTTQLVCVPPPVPLLSLTKQMIAPDGELSTSLDIFPGEEADYLLKLHSASNFTVTAHVEDVLPVQLRAVTADAETGTTIILDGGKRVTWSGEIGPANTPVKIRIHTRWEEDIDCETTITNMASWRTMFQQGVSNLASLRLLCSDLGDAPDSTNHALLPMLAYPGVTANFPTVFAIGPPDPGPKHLNARPFHLGRQVSFELEADIGPDADGVNNIVPPNGVADLDRYDDGLDLPNTALPHCNYGKLTVWIYIDPAAVALFTQVGAPGYLNAWLDGNQDGDWQDMFLCPSSVEALEHIVIDHPISVVGLGAGIHKLVIPTIVPVYHPVDPAWLRLTLSERPSNKTLVSPGGRTYSDGRGPLLPFNLGETEDYLLRAEVLQPDPAVSKVGRLMPNISAAIQMTGLSRDGWPAESFFDVFFDVSYRNQGSSPALDVVVVDLLDNSTPIQVVEAKEHPLNVEPVVLNNSFTFDLGDLAPGQAGNIWIHGRIPITVPPGTVITNVVHVTALQDANLLNNQGVATVTIPLLAPVITYPLNGTTCTGTFTVTGYAQPGVVVDVLDGGALLGSVPVDLTGGWQLPVHLPDGIHVLTAMARTPGGAVSVPSAPVKVIVDSSLFWDPMSLKVHTSAGISFTPYDPSGRIDENGWTIPVFSFTTYTVTFRLCCLDPNAFGTLDVPGVGLLPVTDENGDGVFDAIFTTGDMSAMARIEITLCIQSNLIRRCNDGRFLIDPQGYIRDIDVGSAVQGAQAACYAGIPSLHGLVYGLWPAADYGQENPVFSDQNGFYAFFTPPGTYQVEVDKAGYQPYRTQELVVTDKPVHRDIYLTPFTALVPQSATVVVNDEGFLPSVLVVEPGTVVQWLNLGLEMHGATNLVVTQLRAYAQDDTAATPLSWDSGWLFPGESYRRALPTVGEYLYYDPANPNSQAYIIVRVPPEYRLFLPLLYR